jgi:quinol monooxygenase YgiN
MTYRAPMATILAHITVRPGTEARFESIARELYAATHDQEPSVLRYEYWRGSNERTYYTLLAFTDQNAFLAHQTSDHHEQASGALGEVIESIRLEWVDPIGEAAPLPPTQTQELPADANDLLRRYAVRFAPQIAAWWTR